MAQNWTDNVYQSDHVIATDMQNVENNFAAIKSCFSGASAPSNTVAGMWWYDTSNNILKIRNEANSDWLNVYDFGNQRVYAAKTLPDISITAGTGLSGGGALTTSRTISHSAHTGDVTGATTLTIANNSIGMVKLSNGLVMLPFYQDEDDGTEYNNNTTTPTTVKQAYIYVPSNANGLALRCRIKRSQYVGYCRFKLSTATSSAASTGSSSYAWFNTSGSISGVSAGWHYLEIQLYSSVEGATTYIKGFAFYYY